MKKALLLCLFVVLPVLAQHTGIAGNVRDSEIRQPIVGATVCCYYGNAKTDSAGFYTVSNLAPRKYAVRAMAAGYQTAVYPESVLVEPGRITPDINFYLVRTGSQTGGIAGRVVSQASGQVIVGAAVKASGPNGTKAVIQLCQGYAITGLLPGKYRVSATAPGFEPGCFPESVVVVAGQTADRTDFSLRPCGGELGKIAGIVISAETREPVLGALVEAVGPSRGQANSGPCGRFCIPDLAPGMYVVGATARGFLPFRTDGIEVRAGQVTDMTIALQPCPGSTGGISGTVEDSATRSPVAGAKVLAWGRGGSGFAFTDSQGHYLICALPAGSYLVRACARGYYPARHPEPVVVEAGRVMRVSPGLSMTP